MSYLLHRMIGKISVFLSYLLLLLYILILLFILLIYYLILYFFGAIGHQQFNVWTNQLLVNQQMSDWVTPSRRNLKMHQCGTFQGRRGSLFHLNYQSWSNSAFDSSFSQIKRRNQVSKMVKGSIL